MKKKNKSIQYQLFKARNLYMLYTCLVLDILTLLLGIMVWIENKEFPSDMYINIILSLALISYLIYVNFTRIKRKILSRYGVRHDAEIVKAKYANGAGRCAGLCKYYLEIEFINSKGKKKTFYTPPYEGNPNYYLKSSDCSVFEWKGFYVEDDFQMYDEMDYFGYAGIPTEEKNFIWR